MDQAGPDGYPGEGELEFASQMLNGRMLLQCGPCVRGYGEGPVLLMMRLVLTEDPQGHVSEHFILHRSWIKAEPEYADGGGSIASTPHASQSSAAGPNTLFASPAPLLSDQAGGPAALTRDFTEEMLILTSAGCHMAAAAATVYTEELPTSILGEVEMAKKEVRDAVTQVGFPVSEYLQCLASAAVVVFNRRLTDFHLRDYILLFYLMEGDNRIRAHNGTLYTYSGGVWKQFSGLISDAALGRTKAFLLHLEGLFRLLPKKVVRARHTTLSAVLKIFSSYRTQDEQHLLAKFVDKCIFGMGTTPLTAQNELLQAEDGEYNHEVMPDASAAAPEAAGVWDDKPGVPWTVHVANALIRVSSTLLSHLMAKRFYQMLVEWCATPCLGLNILL